MRVQAEHNPASARIGSAKQYTRRFFCRHTEIAYQWTDASPLSFHDFGADKAGTDRRNIDFSTVFLPQCLQGFRRAADGSKHGIPVLQVTPHHIESKGIGPARAGNQYCLCHLFFPLLWFPGKVYRTVPSRRFPFFDRPPFIFCVVFRAEQKLDMEYTSRHSIGRKTRNGQQPSAERNLTFG